MKKVLALLLTIIMLLGVLVTTAFAQTPTKGYLLTDYGQKHWFLGSRLDYKGTANVQGGAYYLATEENGELCGYLLEGSETDHTYDNGVVTREPTNAKDGIMTYTCTACGITKTEYIDKLGPTNPENKGKNSYKIMGSNILKVAYFEKETPTTRFNDIMNAFKSFNPDIFGLQECDALWHEVLDGENGFKTLGYAQAVTGFGTVDNPIYYKTDKFEVLDCGLTKYNVNSGYFYTWALFEVKETGEQFIVSCTHFTWMDYDKSVDTAEARELVAGLSALEAKYGVPVIAVGDYNSTMAEEAYTVMTDAYSSARDYAAMKVNMDYKTMVKPGKIGNAPSKGTFVLDHIFYTKDKVIGEKYEVFIGPEAYAYSDHLPHMLTFKLPNVTMGGDTNEGGDTDIEVDGSYGEKDDTEKVISVDIGWTMPVFTFTVERRWDPNLRIMTIVEGSGKWSEDPATITLDNRSNQAISASFEFETVIENSGIDGKFTSDKAGTETITSVTLGNAETNAGATSDTVYFFITDGALPSTYPTGGTIGKITVTIDGIENN